jgi:hypothetical protein
MVSKPQSRFGVRPRSFAFGVAVALAIGFPGKAAAIEAPDGPASGALEEYARLLRTYVNPEGVRYDDWRRSTADVVSLGRVVTAWSRIDPSVMGPAERNALYINLYNAKILDLVLEGEPESSIRDLSRIFSFTGKYEIFFRDVLEFDGREISLHALEKRLREESGDPRIHFVINCASRSCPPLADEPFRAGDLDRRLDEATREYLATSEGAMVEDPRTVRVSKIFDWFDGDFGGRDGVRSFLLEYGTEPVRAALRAGARVRHLYYDWSLNEAP